MGSLATNMNIVLFRELLAPDSIKLLEITDLDKTFVHLLSPGPLFQTSCCKVPGQPCSHRQL